MGQVGTDEADASGHPNSNDTKVTSYKITISILFGVLGFAVNFYPVDFVFYGTYKMSFLLGLVFPMLITLAWGLRYGLLSALAGGCQTMWLLWMSGSGYAPLVSVPPFTLWIVWHGWFLRTGYSIYLGELIFRIFNTALLYTVFRWAFTLNVPPANTYMPLAVAHSIVFKEAINGLLIIFIAQGLLYSNPVREFLKLPESTADPRLYYIYTNAAILGGILIFSFIGEMYIWGLWGPEFQYAARILGSVLLLMIGILCTYSAANVFAKRKTEELIHAEEVLRESEKRLSQIIDGSSIPTFVIDSRHAVTHWNMACERLTGIPASEIVGTSRHWSAFYPVERPLMADLVVDELPEEEIARYYGGTCQRSTLIDGSYKTEKFFQHLGSGGRWLFFTATPLKNREGEITGAIETLQDVTARNRAEQALRESNETYLETIIKTSYDGIFVIDTDGNFEFGNDATFAILGWSRDELIGGSFMKVLPPDVHKFALERWDEVRRGRGKSYEVDIVRKDGERRSLSVSHADMETLGQRKYCAVVRDITEQKAAEAELKRHRDHLEELVKERTEKLKQEISERVQAEKELTKSEAKYRVLADNSIDCIWQMNMNFEFTYANPSILQIFGFTQEEWIGSSLSEHCSPGDLRFISGLARDELKKGPGSTGVTFETQLFHKNGETVPVEITAMVSFDEDGTPVEFQGATRDITDRKMADEALRESEEKYRVLFETAKDAIFLSDEAGGFVDVNSEACQSLGYDREELLKMSNRELDADLRGYETFTRLRDGLTKEAVFEVNQKRKDGTLMPVEISGNVIDCDGGKIFLAIARDITKRKRAGEELKQTLADLKRSNTDLEQFAYVISHDLQEPLRMVSGYMQLLKRRYDGKLDSDADDFIGFAVDGASRMQMLIHDLLTYSRVGTRGKSFTPTDCEEILQQVLANLKLAIKDGDAVVTHDPLPTVAADASQLAQIFQNLIGNAIKFRGKEPPCVHISAEQKGDEWEFSVADNGIGISLEFFERIFVIFQRLHARDEYGGTGIGLSVCKKIVGRHGGRIWVESELAKGATFYFTIPARGRNE